MKNFLVFGLLLLTLSCGQKDKAEKVKVANIMMAPPVVAEDKMAADKPSPINKTVQDTSKKIIKEGEISFETGNIKETRKAINDSLDKLGGYIADESETNNSDNNRKEFDLKIRVPSKNFDKFLNGVSSFADKIDSKNIRIKDVTTQYIDISTQLANKKKLESRYLELLKKGNKISDLLEIENKLTEIRSDIESTQGQLNYLIKQVEYSSLDITFYTKQAVQDNGQTFSYKLKTALSGGWDFLGSLFFDLITLWPLWIIITLLYILIKSWRNKIRKRKVNP